MEWMLCRIRIWHAAMSKLCPKKTRRVHYNTLTFNLRLISVKYVYANFRAIIHRDAPPNKASILHLISQSLLRHVGILSLSKKILSSSTVPQYQIPYPVDWSLVHNVWMDFLHDQLEIWLRFYNGIGNQESEKDAKVATVGIRFTHQSSIGYQLYRHRMGAFASRMSRLLWYLSR